MISRIVLFFIAVMITVPNVNAQPGVHTLKTGGDIIQIN